MSAPSPGTALILGLDTPAGAYLARLLHARGQTVAGIAPATAPLLGALGSDQDVALHPAASLPDLLAGASVLYLVAQPHPAADALAAAAMAAAPAAARLVHVLDRDLLHTHAPARARRLAALRRETGRYAANAILHAHDSRLGAPDTLPARIAAAAHAASTGPAGTGQAMPLDLPDTPPEDWGWTAEYVDAIARLAALPAATDIEIGSGAPLSARDMVAHALRWFRLTADQLPLSFTRLAALQPAPAPDIPRLKTLLGWRATTTGADLMDTLCEAAAVRAGHGS
jgi:nucleoside-diphosphate-sugar epimerase